jgi:hypothetical protein
MAIADKSRAAPRPIARAYGEPGGSRPSVAVVVPDRDPREALPELRAIRRRLEVTPKVRAAMFPALVELAGELEDWQRSVRRWAKEYGANLMKFVEQLEGRVTIDDGEE